jgi:hypothetical protein
MERKKQASKKIVDETPSERILLEEYQALHSVIKWQEVRV